MNQVHTKSASVPVIRNPIKNRFNIYLHVSRRWCEEGGEKVFVAFLNLVPVTSETTGSGGGSSRPIKGITRVFLGRICIHY
jgi:hypothetical protein